MFLSAADSCFAFIAPEKLPEVCAFLCRDADLDNIKLDTEHLEMAQKEIYLREYENALEMDVGRIVEQKQLVPKEVRVRLSKDYEVESIEMTVAFGEDDSMFMQKAFYENDSTEYPKVYELKQNLMEYYRLDESQISIAIV